MKKAKDGNVLRILTTMNPTHLLYCAPSLEKVWSSHELFGNFCGLLGQETSFDPLLAYEGPHGSILRLQRQPNLPPLIVEDLVTPTEEETELLAALKFHQCHDVVVVRPRDLERAREFPISELGYCEVRGDPTEEKIQWGSLVLLVLRYPTEE